MFTELGRIGCSFLACCGGLGNFSNMFDISQTLHKSVSGLWLHPLGNYPVVDL